MFNRRRDTRRERMLEPSLEHPDTPERVSVIGAARLVREKAALEVVDVHVVGNRSSPTQYFIPEHRGLGSRDPVTNRDGEAAFRKLPQTAWESPLRELPEQHFSLSTLLFR